MYSAFRVLVLLLVLFPLLSALLPTTSRADEAVVHPRFTHPGAGQTIYLLMPDRFANGRTDNDTGGLPGGTEDHGFDPTRTGGHRLRREDRWGSSA